LALIKTFSRFSLSPTKVLIAFYLSWMLFELQQ
jgi:hypothetical protein